MADPQIIKTLSTRRDEIERTILLYEERIKGLRSDLMHVNATIRLFEVNGEPTQFPVHIGLGKQFRRGELFSLAQEALQAAGKPLSTREIAAEIIRARGMDDGDKVLRTTLTYSLVQALRRQERLGRVVSVEKRRGVKVWKDALSGV